MNSDDLGFNLAQFATRSTMILAKKTYCKNWTVGKPWERGYA